MANLAEIQCVDVKLLYLDVFRLVFTVGKSTINNERISIVNAIV